MFKLRTIFIILVNVTVAFLLVWYFYYGVTTAVSVNRQGEAGACSPQAPIYVKVTNLTFKKIKRINFSLELFKNERSKNLLLDAIYSGYTFDLVVDPFSSKYGCYSDKYITNLIVKKSIDYSTLKKIDVAESIPRSSLASMISEVHKFKKFADTHKIYISDVNIVYIN